MKIKLKHLKTSSLTVYETKFDYDIHWAHNLFTTANRSNRYNLLKLCNLTYFFI